MKAHVRLAIIGRMLCMLLFDMLLTGLAIWLATVIRFESGMASWQRNALHKGIPYILAVYAACYLLGGQYRVLWRYAGVSEIIRLVVTCIAACLITIGINSLANIYMSRSHLVLTAVLSLALIIGSRFFYHWYISRKGQHAKTRESERMLIIGAGNAGAYAVNMCRTNAGSFGYPVAFLDDDPAKQRMHIHGLPVVGTIRDLPDIVEKKKIDSILIAVPTMNSEDMRRLTESANATRRRVYIFSAPSEMKGDVRPTIRQLRVSDFLTREEVKLDTEGILSYIKGRTVLVTGGGGSIGSEICRQVCAFSPARLVIFDIYENTAYELLYDLRLRFGEDLCPTDIIIGSIRDKARLDEVFETYKPQVVFHAAAHKHVPLMEVSPSEAVKNNIFGTYNLLVSASEHGVERLVQLSTDKAVNPTNVMGATKRVTEMLIQMFAKRTDMKCMAVRFGNVLGSHGSVIPLWEQQIRSGGPVTVVDPNITRYFMTIPEAAQLVLQAGALAQSGSIYVLNMGTPVRMMDLAEKLIRFYGYRPGTDMQISITGLRPGEKMYEELMMDSERRQMTATSHDRIMIAPPIDMDLGAFSRELDDLRASLDTGDDAIVESLVKITGTYVPNRKKAAI